MKLRNRLLGSYLAVVAGVAVVGYVIVRLLTPDLVVEQLQNRIGGGSGQARRVGPGGSTDGTATEAVIPTEIQESYDAALANALLIAAAAGLMLSVVLALVLSRRLVRPLDSVRAAASRFARGDYTQPVPVPHDVELGELATSVNELGATLASTEQSRSRLVSDLAHELRNPLMSVAGSIEGILDGVIEPNDATLEAVLAETSRLQRLTEDLSLLATAQEGGLSYDMEVIDLGDVVQAVAAMLRPQYEAAEVALEVDMPEAVSLRGDRDRLQQAITNVVGNALGHSHPDDTVRVVSARHGGQIHLAVIDEGDGIPPDRLDSVFERFTRLDTTSRPGSGIGLSIARTIAHAHGGELVAASDGPNQGSTFTLTLPTA